MGDQVGQDHIDTSDFYARTPPTTSDAGAMMDFSDRKTIRRLQSIYLSVGAILV
jgi:hypothetical protein